MRFENYLTEKYLASVKSRWIRGGIAEIFINPNKLDFNSMVTNGVDEIRFMADNVTKNVFVWNADSSLHSEVWAHSSLSKYSGGRLPLPYNTELFTGTAYKKGNKFVMFESDQFDSDLNGNNREYKDRALKIISQDWNWVNKYVDMSNWLNKARNKFKEELKEF